MSLELVVGAVGIAGLCAYMLFKLGDNDRVEGGFNTHYGLQIILYAMIVMMVYLAGNAAYNGGEVCDHVIDHTFSNETSPTAAETDINTTYYYSLDCQENPNLTGKSMFRVVNWFLRLMFLYLMGYVLYNIFKPIYLKLRGAGIGKE